MIVLQLGELRLKSEQHQIHFEEDDSTELEFDLLKAKAYDRYSLEMVKLQILAANPGDSWRKKLEAGGWWTWWSSSLLLLLLLL